MELKNIINKLSNKHKGTFVRVGWSSNIESAAARKSGVQVVKETDATVRWGVRYDNLKRVKEIKALEGKVEETKQRKLWYKHLDDTPYIVENLNDADKKYLQLFTINNRRSIKTKYFVNGNEITKKELANSGYVNASNLESKGECLVMNIPINNIRFIGKEVK